MADLDLASIIGLILCAIVVVFGIVYGQSGAEVLLDFYDPPSILITFGGALCWLLIMAPSLKGFLRYLKSFTRIYEPLISV